MEQQTHEPLRGGRETILLVEDEVGIRTVARQALMSYGYRVLEADTGLDALAVWEKHRLEIALVMTDLVMPEGMTGLELGDHLMRENPDVRVIYTSGYSPAIAGNRIPSKPGATFIPKPYDIATLIKTVRDTLDAKVD